MGMLHNLADLIKIKKDKMTILVLGLNNSGKSSIINHFKKSSEQTSIVVPTVGFMVEQFYSKWLWTFEAPSVIIYMYPLGTGMSGVSIKAIDMSGATRYRNLWEHQFKNCHGIIYVIDSSDRMRFGI